MSSSAIETFKAYGSSFVEKLGFVKDEAIQWLKGPGAELAGRVYEIALGVITTSGAALSQAIGFCKDEAITYGGLFASTAHGFVAGPAVTFVNGLYASGASISPYAGPVLALTAVAITVVTAQKLMKTDSKIKNVIGGVLGVGAGIATAAIFGAAAGAVSSAAYLAGGIVVASALLFNPPKLLA